MNNIYLILSAFAFLIVSDLSADTRDNNSNGNSAPSEEEVRNAVVRALLDQENKLKKMEPEPLKEVETSIAPLADRHQKKLDINTIVLMKAKQKDQDKQRIEIEKAVVAANKSRKRQSENKKLPPSVAITKKAFPAPLRVVSVSSEKDMPKVADIKPDTSLKTISNELANKPKPQVEAIENIPVGRNQLATNGMGALNIKQKNIIEVLNTKQGLASPLSKNTVMDKLELPLNMVENTAEGRNKSVVKQVQGWIYLGRFESGIWENKTLNIKKQLPQVGKQYVIKATSLYVRNALPKKGKMGKVIHAFHSDDEIKILNLKGLGRNRDFYWAKISSQ